MNLRHVALWFLLLCGSAFAQEFGERGEGGNAQIDPVRPEEVNLKTVQRNRQLQELQLLQTEVMFGVIDENAYMVGPGDVFYVAMGTLSFDTPVGPDGYIVIQSFPPVLVGNKSLAEAKKALLEKLGRYFKAGGIYVALSGAKKFQVSITGMVSQPGFYIASAGSRLSSVIQSAGGLTPQASLQVTIHRTSGKTDKINLATYYRDGDLSQNPYVSQGDQVLVAGIDYATPYVNVQNDKGTRLVQLLAGDNLEDVVERATGFEKTKDWDHVNIYRDGKFVQKVERLDSRTFSPQSGTTLEVRATQLYVFIGGTVIAPGAILYNPTYSMLDYIAKAGITINTGDASRVMVMDKSGNVRKVDAKREAPKPGDHIIVPRSFEAKARDYIALTAAISSLAVAIATFLVLLDQQN